LELTHAILNDVILNDLKRLTKFLTTWSVAWPRCNSWASCCICYFRKQHECVIDVIVNQCVCVAQRPVADSAELTANIRTRSIQVRCHTVLATDICSRHLTQW